jgi:Xaa-Pro aminopeptidase
MDRRTFITASAVSGLATATPSLAGPTANKAPLPKNPGIDRDRARFILKQTGFDAVILGRPENIFYTTGRWPFMPRLGLNDASFAILPADSAAPIIFVLPQFPYYYTVADTGLAAGVEPRLVTTPYGDAASAAFFFADSPDAQLSAREIKRRTKTEAAKPYFPTTTSALFRALSQMGVLSGRLGFDSAEAQAQLSLSTPAAQLANAIDAVKAIRLVKTEYEIGLMRAASKTNVIAAGRAARKMRELGTIKNLRNHFNAEASRLGNVPGFMVVNGSVDEAYDEEFVHGTSVLIDCVSTLQGYHGDYGRTVFIGEPRQPMANKVKAMGQAWNELRTKLKPGMRFSEISREGGSILKKMGHNLNIPFGPHSVGLAHTEQPMLDAKGNVIDTILEPGMIISVDCPLMEASTLGTAHLEYLTLITKDGFAPIHDIGNSFIVT